MDVGLVVVGEERSEDLEEDGSTDFLLLENRLRRGIGGKGVC